MYLKEHGNIYTRHAWLQVLCVHGHTYWIYLYIDIVTLTTIYIWQGTLDIYNYICYLYMAILEHAIWHDCLYDHMY